MWEEEPTKRTLTIRERQILWERANHRCENPFCGKEIDFTEMQVGHKIPYSKGGSTTLRNSVCLCYKCNKLQGTDTWRTFLKKQQPQRDISGVKNLLKGLSTEKLGFLAKKHNIKVKGRVEAGFWSDSYKPPSKTQYINALSKQLSEEDVKTTLKTISPKQPRKRRKKPSSSWSLF